VAQLSYLSDLVDDYYARVNELLI